ncbi:MAG: alpha/beta fold hydrolase [Bradymonadia bacterium]
MSEKNVGSADDLNILKIPTMCLIEHRLEVPLDHGAPEGETLTIFAREFRARGAESEKRPYLLYLQGGPGFQCQRPTRRSGWMDRALEEFHVVLLDQRGTGQSTPVCQRRLLSRGDTAAQVNYLKHFRADAIVADCELLREYLIGRDGKWWLLGQSFGGFCALTYLCHAPDGLSAAMFTGGLPPIEGGPDPVYESLFERVLARDQAYFDRYPKDRVTIETILELAQRDHEKLPSGTALDRHLLQHLGIVLGADDGAERLHFLLADAISEANGHKWINYRFKVEIDGLVSMNTNPIYALLHEAIYCQGKPSKWSAQRVMSSICAYQEERFVFTGEMVFPWMFDSMPELAPLAELAHAIAQKDDWPQLYDRARLAQNKVPCAAAVYDDDMYVERAFSSQTARTVANMHAWVTNEYEHNGLRADGKRILSRLLGMIRGEH